MSVLSGWWLLACCRAASDYDLNALGDDVEYAYADQLDALWLPCPEVDLAPVADVSCGVDDR